MKGARGGLASVRPPNGRCQVVSINGPGAGPASEVCGRRGAGRRGAGSHGPLGAKEGPQMPLLTSLLSSPPTCPCPCAGFCDIASPGTALKAPFLGSWRQDCGPHSATVLSPRQPERVTVPPCGCPWPLGALIGHPGSDWQACPSPGSSMSHSSTP